VIGRQRLERERLGAREEGLRYLRLFSVCSLSERRNQVVMLPEYLLSFAARFDRPADKNLLDELIQSGIYAA